MANSRGFVLILLVGFLAINLPAQVSNGTNAPNRPLALDESIRLALKHNYNAAGVDIVSIDATADANIGPRQNLPDALTEGTFLVTRRPHRSTQRFQIYRLGTRRTEFDNDPNLAPNSRAWELQPGYELTIYDPNNAQYNEEIPNPGDALSQIQPEPGPMPAWCVGCERLSDGSFIGASQDISAFTTVIKVKP